MFFCASVSVGVPFEKVHVVFVLLSDNYINWKILSKVYNIVIFLKKKKEEKKDQLIMFSSFLSLFLFNYKVEELIIELYSNW